MQKETSLKHFGMRCSEKQGRADSQASERRGAARTWLSGEGDRSG